MYEIGKAIADVEMAHDPYSDFMSARGFGLPHPLNVAPYWRHANHNAVHSAHDASQLVNDEKKFAVSIDVSHFKPEELKVHIDGHNLIIEGKQIHNDEHSHSMRSFSRSFVLPPEVDLDAIRSHLSDEGHLSVEAPKAGHALNYKRHVNIEAASHKH